MWLTAFKRATPVNYEGKMKSSRPSLQSTWNSGQADVGHGPGQELVSPPHYEYDKAFLIAAYGSMGIGSSIRARWKVLGLVYNWRETRTSGRWAGTRYELVSPCRDKRPLGKKSNRGWCNRLNSVKLFWSQPIAPRISAAAYDAALSMDPWAAIKKA